MDIKLPFSIDETPGAEYTERSVITINISKFLIYCIILVV